MVVIMLVMCFWHVNGCSLKNYAGRKQLHCQVGNVPLFSRESWNSWTYCLTVHGYDVYCDTKIQRMYSTMKRKDVNRTNIVYLVK